jgi:hypothetical protein
MVWVVPMARAMFDRRETELPYLVRKLDVKSARSIALSCR